jgi:hypothetical protein
VRTRKPVRAADPAAFHLQPLSWHQVSARPEAYELRAIPGPLGRLTFEGRRAATASTLHETWRFLAQGILRPTVIVTPVPVVEVLATCRFGFWGSTASLELSRDTSIRLGPVSDQSYSARTSAGQDVFSYDLRGFMRLRAPLEWGPASGLVVDYPWLLYFGWYLAVRYYHEILEAAGAAVITG